MVCITSASILMAKMLSHGHILLQRRLENIVYFYIQEKMEMNFDDTWQRIKTHFRIIIEMKESQ